MVSNANTSSCHAAKFPLASTRKLDVGTIGVDYWSKIAECAIHLT